MAGHKPLLALILLEFLSCIIPCAVALRLLLGEPVLVCHPRLAKPLELALRLGASVGAPGPHAFAVREPCRSSSAPPRPPHPATNVCAVRDTLLPEGSGTGENIRLFYKTEVF
jgi:hypothetical protein